VESFFGQVGLVGVFLNEMAVENRGRKNLLPPLLRASRGRRRPTVPFKTTPFWVFFFNELCMKRRRFGQNASFHLKGKGGKNVSEFALVLNL
jgi:hypothetical protein